MINLAINQNTKIPSVAKVLQGYFGLGEFGVKLADSETVFRESDVKAIAQIPDNAFETYQPRPLNNGKITDKDPISGKFILGNNLGTGRPKGAKNKKNSTVTELIKEVAQEKHYEIKGSSKRVSGIKLIAEAIVDGAVKGNKAMIDIFLDRTEGKVKQSIQMSGTLPHGVMSDEERKRLTALFSN
ncbi:MAG: hypothetical protein RL641_37 [Candidatus Parcubacteria bacterium]|jgi:hypothetical protein